MNTSMKIKRKLPDVPRMTRTVRDDRYYSYGKTHVGYREPSKLDKIVEEKIRHQSEGMQEMYTRRKEEAEKRWQQVAELARQGLGDEEIGKLTGYSPNTVCDIVRKMRRRGDDIPPRKKGPRHG